MAILLDRRMEYTAGRPAAQEPGATPADPPACVDLAVLRGEIEGALNEVVALRSRLSFALRPAQPEPGNSGSATSAPVPVISDLQHQLRGAVEDLSTLRAVVLDINDRYTL